MTPEQYALLNNKMKEYQDAAKSGKDTGVLDTINNQILDIGKTPTTTPQATANSIATPTTSGTGTSNYNDYINQLYAAKNSAALTGLRSAYNQNMSTLDAQKAKIPEQYTAARNQTAGTYETNRANLNERAAATGMNSGAGSQLALSMANNYAGNLNTLNKSEANALSDIEAKKADLATDFNTRIAQAQAENDLAKAQALYEEGVRAQNQLISQQQYDTERQTSADNTAYNKNVAMAETLAQYGDFSGYKALGYTDAQIAAMQATYNASKQKTTKYSGSSNSKNTPIDTTTPTVEFNSAPTIDETSPMGIITDISALRKQGYTNAQIKANAKSAYEAGTITGAQYQMYVQYAGA